MSQERSLDHFVESLEKRARIARTISVAITIGVVVIGVVTVFFTSRQIRQRIGEEQGKLTELQGKIDKAKEDLDVTQHQLDVNRNALSQLAPEQRAALLNEGEKITNQQEGSSSAKAKVYLQILDNTQRAAATAIGRKLTSNGFDVQGVEWVTVSVGIKQTLVKYFKPEFADEAQQIVSILKQSGIQAVAVAPNVSSGQIEIWFSNDAFPSGATTQSGQNAALAKQADDVMFEFFEALQRPEDKTEATNRLQTILAQLEQDKDVAPYVKASGVSSKDTNNLRTGLLAIRNAVAADKKGSVLDRINKLIVDIGKPSYKKKS